MQIWRFYTNNSTINDALSPLQQVAHGDKSKNKWIRGKNNRNQVGKTLFRKIIIIKCSNF